MGINLKSAVSHINKHGVLLVYPIKNKSEVPSLWNCYFPKSKMKWAWTEDGDNRVAELWHLREKLSRSRQVVYTKWFGGRATFMSFPIFTALLSYTAQTYDLLANMLGNDAKALIKALEEDSPLPTKVLRMETGLEGKFNESRFNKGLRELWSKLLIVGFGEVEEGGFPSLAVGASKLIFEELWDDAIALKAEIRDQILSKAIPSQSPFYASLTKYQNRVRTEKKPPL